MFMCVVIEHFFCSSILKLKVNYSIRVREGDDDNGQIRVSLTEDAKLEDHCHTITRHRPSEIAARNRCGDGGCGGGRPMVIDGRWSKSGEGREEDVALIGSVLCLQLD